MLRLVRARLRAVSLRLSTTLSTPRARRAAHAAGHVATLLLMLSVPAAAYAQPSPTPAPPSLPQVIDNLRAWIMGILWSLAGLYALIGALYRMTAGGDPTKVEKGNAALRNAAIGAGLAVLSPVILQVVKGIVGG